jgi:hypothetical protein
MGYGEEEDKLREEKTNEQKQIERKEHEIFNPFASRAPSDQAAQVRAALFAIPLPTEKNFHDWFPVLRAAIDIVARVPGYDTKVYNELNRDMEDLVDRANSQGRRKIVASKMQKFIFKLRALVPKGDVPIAGMTGITAMITSNAYQKQVQEVRMPVQQAAGQSLFSGVKAYLNRK